MYFPSSTQSSPQTVSPSSSVQDLSKTGSKSSSRRPLELAQGMQEGGGGAAAAGSQHRRGDPMAGMGLACGCHCVSSLLGWIRSLVGGEGGISGAVSSGARSYEAPSVVTPGVSFTSRQACGTGGGGEPERGRLLPESAKLSHCVNVREGCATKEGGMSRVGSSMSLKKARKGMGSSLSLADDDDFCPTCLEAYTMENPKIMTKCHHHFHLSCIYEWLERANTCPVCFRPMNFDELT